MRRFDFSIELGHVKIANISLYAIGMIVFLAFSPVFVVMASYSPITETLFRVLGVEFYLPFTSPFSLSTGDVGLISLLVVSFGSVAFLSVALSRRYEKTWFMALTASKITVGMAVGSIFALVGFLFLAKQIMNFWIDLQPAYSIVYYGASMLNQSIILAGAVFLFAVHTVLVFKYSKP